MSHHVPVPSAAGTYNDRRGGVNIDACRPCSLGQDSVSGSGFCTFCAAGYYRPDADSPTTTCTSCGGIPGIRCGSNATIAALNITARYWRHSTATLETHLCKSDGSWSPCKGGADAGAEGDGYCAEGYRGPRCELCDGPAYSRYFDKLEARCHACGDLTARTIVAVCLMLLLILSGTRIMRRLKRFNICSALLRSIRTVKAIWQEAGMRYKIKVLVGFYQCLAAVPSVYSVQPPLGLEEYTRWIHLLELPSEFERIFQVHTACLGDYRTRIWVGSIWPLVVILAYAMCLVGSKLLQRCSRGLPSWSAVRTTVLAALRRVLPLTLGLTFLVLPSTSTRIFRAFLCETFEYDANATSSRRYLYADLTLSCDSDEYEATRTTALMMLTVWPVGIPMLYMALLWVSRNAICRGKTTQLSAATQYLWGDYDGATFWWEPLEMCRKLTLSTSLAGSRLPSLCICTQSTGVCIPVVAAGWVLLIRHAEQGRVFVAVFVSITFFGLNLRFRPLRR